MGQPRKDTTAITFRCGLDVVEQLDEICQLAGMKRSEFFITAIKAEYDKINGNPQMKELLEQLKQITETMKTIEADTLVRKSL